MVKNRSLYYVIQLHGIWIEIIIASLDLCWRSVYIQGMFFKLLEINEVRIVLYLLRQFYIL